jgi:excisionase family DNA binding protein
MPDLWLTVQQAARDLGIAERTCRKWLAEGRLEGRRDRKGNRDGLGSIRGPALTGEAFGGGFPFVRCPGRGHSSEIGVRVTRRRAFPFKRLGSVGFGQLGIFIGRRADRA